jgi:hypothetical protein
MTSMRDARLMVSRHALGLALVLALALATASSHAIAPALLLVIKQIAKQAATQMFKDAVLSGLDGMGCKGMALSNALQAFELRRAGGAMPAFGMPSMPGMPALPAGMGMPAGALGMPNLSSVPAEMTAKLQSMMPDASQLPPGAGISPDMMAQLRQAMAQPLSPAETLATIDELAVLGFLPKAMQTELKECMVLIPSASATLGMGMGMLRPVIPQLRSAREQLHALSPAEQDEVALTLVQELRALPADQRAALIEHLDSGFFPPRVSAGVKARLAASPPD